MMIRPIWWSRKPTVIEVNLRGRPPVGVVEPRGRVRGVVSGWSKGDPNNFNRGAPASIAKARACRPRRLGARIRFRRLARRIYFAGRAHHRSPRRRSCPVLYKGPDDPARGQGLQWGRSSDSPLALEPNHLASIVTTVVEAHPVSPIARTAASSSRIARFYGPSDSGRAVWWGR